MPTNSYNTPPAITTPKGQCKHGMVSGVPWHTGVLGLVDLGIRIAQLDGDIALKLILETDGLDATDGFHHR